MAGPAQPGAGCCHRQQLGDNGGKECHRLLQPVMHNGIAEFGDLQQRHPARGLTQRKPARPTRQGKPQQARPVADFASALNCFGLQCLTIEVRPTGSRSNSSLNGSVGTDAVFCIRPWNQAESRRVKRYLSAHDVSPPFAVRSKATGCGRSPRFCMLPTQPPPFNTSQRRSTRANPGRLVPSGSGALIAERQEGRTDADYRTRSGRGCCSTFRTPAPDGRCAVSGATPGAPRCRRASLALHPARRRSRRVSVPRRRRAMPGELVVATVRFCSGASDSCRGSFR